MKPAGLAGTIAAAMKTAEMLRAKIAARARLLAFSKVFIVVLLILGLFSPGPSGISQ